MKASTAAILALSEASRALQRASEATAAGGFVAAASLTADAAGAVAAAIGKVVVAAGCSRCSVCDAPAHASETDDLDRCETCRPAAELEVAS